MILLTRDIIDSTIGINCQIYNSNTICTVAHSHDFYEIFIVIEGNMKYICNNQEQILSKNSLIFVFPEYEHYYKQIKGKILNIAFTTDIFNFIENLLCIRKYEEIILDDIETLQIVNEILRISTQKLSNYELSINLKRLLVIILSLFSQTQLQKRYPIWLKSLLDKINKKHNFTIGLQSIYHLSPKTPEYTTRAFRKYLNTTPTEYINNLRLNYAKNLLLTTNNSITDICFDVGFNDTSYFYVCFKKKFKQSPSEFRELNKRPLIF